MSLCLQFVKLETCYHLYCYHHATCAWSSLFCWHVSYKWYFKTYHNTFSISQYNFYNLKTYSITNFHNKISTLNCFKPFLWLCYNNIINILKFIF
jgi:hypothetical protein